MKYTTPPALRPNLSFDEVLERLASTTTAQAVAHSASYDDELWDRGSTAHQDMVELLHGTSAFEFWVECCATVEDQLDDAGLRLFDNGRHFGPLYTVAIWYTAAILVKAVPQYSRKGGLLLDLAAPFDRAFFEEEPDQVFCLSEADHADVEIAQLTEAPVLLVPGPVAFSYQYARDVSGQRLDSQQRDEWLEARRQGVTATDVGKLVKLNGIVSVQRPGLLLKKLSGEELPDFAMFQHGRDREPIIAEWVRETYGVEHNTFLLAGKNPRHLATPDGIGGDGICEIKTSSTPLAKIRSRYRDQLQWQLHVTGAPRLLFVVEHRYTLEREVMWVLPDHARISVLARHADSFLEEMDSARQLVTAGSYNEMLPAPPDRRAPMFQPIPMAEPRFVDTQPDFAGTVSKEPLNQRAERLARESAPSRPGPDLSFPLAMSGEPPTPLPLVAATLPLREVVRPVTPPAAIALVGLEPPKSKAAPIRLPVPAPTSNIPRRARQVMTAVIWALVVVVALTLIAESTIIR